MCFVFISHCSLNLALTWCWGENQILSVFVCLLVCWCVCLFILFCLFFFRTVWKTFSGVFKRGLVLFFQTKFSRFFYFSYTFNLIVLYLADIRRRCSINRRRSNALWSTIRGNRHSSDANRHSTIDRSRLVEGICISLPPLLTSSLMLLLCQIKIKILDRAHLFMRPEQRSSGSKFLHYSLI